MIGSAACSTCPELCAMTTGGYHSSAIRTAGVSCLEALPVPPRTTIFFGQRRPNSESVVHCTAPSTRRPPGPSGSRRGCEPASSPHPSSRGLQHLRPADSTCCVPLEFRLSSALEMWVRTASAATQLSVDGVPLIIDSGTYAYTFDVAARNAFRSTRAHNTLVVDGEEIQPIDEDRVFELRRFARPRVETLRLDGDALELVGTHDGYRRRASPVLHRRRFSLNVTSEELTVHDEVVGKGEHILESFLHFAAGVALQPSTDGSYAVASERANGLLVWSGIDPTESHVEQGWVSSSYGTRERAPV
ncbi:MAG: hypothetical protein E6G15_09265, partial [Actinobacteria bacterium]